MLLVDYLELIKVEQNIGINPSIDKSGTNSRNENPCMDLFSG